MQLSVKEVAKLLNVSEKSIYRWIQGKSIPVYKINETYRFNRAELLLWANSRKINVSHQLMAEPETENEILPSLSEALEQGGIYYRIGGIGKKSALKSMVDVLRLPEDLDKEFLLNTLIARENLGTTAIGGGIAIPHPRNPISIHGFRPFVALCFLEEAVDFYSLDGFPVQALFALISPSMRAHLHILKRLTFALNDPGFKAVIAKQGSRDEIMEAVREVESKIHIRPQLAVQET